MKRILNCLPSPKQEDDWRLQHAAAANRLELAALPVAIDLRAPWWNIGNQASSGACVGWALADSVLRWHFVGTDRLAPDEHLSPRFIWMAAKESDEFKQRPTSFVEASGTSLKAALHVARKFGCVTDRVLPFEPDALYKEEEQTFYILASERKIANYINLGRDLQRWRTWLALSGPVLVRLDVDDAWDQASATAGELDTYRQPAGPRGHAVALVGYTHTHFIVRNSWGEEWGDQGYAYASLPYALAAFTEAYGVAL